MVDEPARRAPSGTALQPATERTGHLPAAAREYPAGKSILSTLISALMSAAISAVAGLLGAMWYVRYEVSIPQVAVLDMRKLVQPIANDSSLTAEDKRLEAHRLSDRAREFLTQEARQGVIVLDASAVLRAPESVYVQDSGQR